jgi:hypothetical protein
VKPEIPLLKDAVEKFIADARAQRLNWETVRRYETFLNRRFLHWCESKATGCSSKSRRWRSPSSEGSEMTVRSRAFIWLVRYSGLRLGDAISLNLCEHPDRRQAVYFCGFGVPSE